MSSFIAPFVLSTLVLLIARPVLGQVTARQGPIALADARAGFAEARRLCEADGGRLWGTPLWGDVMLVDPATRVFVATRHDSLGIGREDQGVFTGTLPRDQNVANTAFRWGGVHWSQVLWPLPAAPGERAVLLVHELFHRAQDGLGIRGGTPDNGHLDTVAGRYLIQLEWRALVAALETGEDAERRAAIEDALSFRQARRERFTGSAVAENALERLEGLAEYTGIAIALPSPAERASYARRDIERIGAVPSFVRSFAYASGPAYGLLLDARRNDWRRHVAGEPDLGGLLAEAWGLTVGAEDSAAVARRAVRYGGAALMSSEQRRWDELQARLAEYRKRLVEGPVLRIALRHMKVQFDPRNLVPLGPEGTVYPTMRVTDDWGVLSVTGGALLAADWTSVTVGAPKKDGDSRGEGWELSLEPGWRLVAGERPGSYVLTRQE